MGWENPIGLGPQPNDRTSLIDAARAARRAAESTRANVLERRLTFHRQRRNRERTREKGNITIRESRETCATSRRSYRFGLDWVEPDESLDIVLLVPEP